MPAQQQGDDTDDVESGWRVYFGFTQHDGSPPHPYSR